MNQPHHSVLPISLVTSSIVIMVGFSSCESRQIHRPGDNPISTERQVEYLDLTDGSLPTWKSQGELSVKPSQPKPQ